MLLVYEDTSESFVQGKAYYGLWEMCLHMHLALGSALDPLLPKVMLFVCLTGYKGFREHLLKLWMSTRDHDSMTARPKWEGHVSLYI